MDQVDIFNKMANPTQNVLFGEQLNDYKPLYKEDCEQLLKLLLIELDLLEGGRELEIADSELPFLAQIIKKRVEALKLPIELTNSGLLAIHCFVDNPGKAVTLLIDFLNKFENQKFTVAHPCELYPFGFYTTEKFDQYVDTQIKPRIIKWSEIY